MTTKDIINKYATEIRLENIDTLETSDKILLMFLNYNCGGYLGQAVINDGIYFARNLSLRFNYKCYYICNASITAATELIKKMISTTGKRIIYYSGHGTQVKDYNNDEDDGRDEAFVFKNGYLIDDKFAELLNTYFKCDNLICITDSCHSGTVWDIKNVKESIRKNITCLSACDDNQTAKQLYKNGCFTLQFWQLFDMNKKNINIKELNRRLNIFDQKAIIYPNVKQDIINIPF